MTSFAGKNGSRGTVQPEIIMSEQVVHTVGIIMNGVTGRMGTNQHLLRSIRAIVDQGGVRLNENETIMPEPLLVGRNPVKLEKLAALSGFENWTTNLDEALNRGDMDIYFDAQTTDRRVEAVSKAIEAGKHVYCEKPTALTTSEAVELTRLAEQKGVKNGVVQDKLWLPGLRKLQTLRDTGFFGKILSVRGDFGYWVFEGETVPAQRPSWNYRKEEGGGIILDMFAHWRYVLDNLFGEVKAVCAHGTTLIDRRWDENGRPYDASADDAAYAMFELEGNVIAQFNSSWVTRVRRDDLLTIHVDGTKGSAVAGLRKCFVQPYGATPRPVWNPDVEQGHKFFDDWLPVPEQQDFENAFKIEWELFLRHVVVDAPFKWTLREGAKGVQLAELAYESSRKRAWVDVPEL